jgi:hypothetical protein
MTEPESHDVDEFRREHVVEPPPEYFGDADPFSYDPDDCLPPFIAEGDPSKQLALPRGPTRITDYPDVAARFGLPW